MASALKIGDDAPPFSLSDSSGNMVSLEDYKGKKVYVMALRYSACMMCNLRVKQLTERTEKYKDAGLIVLPVFNTKPEHLEERVSPKVFASDDLHILIDPNGEAMSKYGTKSSCLGSAFGFGPCIQEAKHCNLFQGLCGYFNLSLQHCGCLGCGTNPFAMPGDFMVDEDGKIAKLAYGSAMGDHITWDEVDAFAGVATNESTPMAREAA